MEAEATATPGMPLLGLRAILPMSIAMVALAFLLTFLFGPKPLLAVVAAGTSADRQVGWGIVPERRRRQCVGGCTCRFAAGLGQPWL